MGSSGAARRIRHTADAENDITTARDRSAEAGAAMPNRCSSASSLVSTSEPYRTGCLVSMNSFTGRRQSSTSDTSASSVSKLVSPCAPSSRQLSCQAPYSSSRSCASVIVLTNPAPVEVRSSRRSCTHTRWPSRVSRTSHSTPSAPSLRARS
ncbi:hypothetical protein PICSAR65_04371 [Mycobacterium avium subsp. paratuberculosis]|nr:hypothetical protein PICSAR10_03500 [Mycobacterium avium subsp. paratuberculosis]CAG7348955.1 hypothetical protein PICSAR65_04371 [Mycobacterium avium subsp. paratuberculosis]